MFIVRRSPHNPMLGPVKEHPWEAFATFNWSPAKIGRTTYFLYRAMSSVQQYGEQTFRLSTIGRTKTTDGIRFGRRERFIAPEYPWEQYGCEDPRVSKFEGSYYIFYTAIGSWPPGPDNIRVAVAVSHSPKLRHIDEKHLVTPFNSKAMALFPERINGKVTVVLTADSDHPPSKMAIAQCDSVEDLWREDFWKEWYPKVDMYQLRPQRTDKDQIEVGAAPIKTKRGWLLIYSHIQNYLAGRPIFGIEALLLDLKNPLKIIGRTTNPLIVPEEVYERYGEVPNVIFPSGALLEKGEVKFFYGSADTTCCEAKVNLKDLLESIEDTSRLKQMKRYEENPVLVPLNTHPWESRAVFNPAALELEGKVHILYRAMSEDNTSVIGYAMSRDGVHIEERDPSPCYVPREDFEKKKGSPTGNSGCEDPRLTYIDGKVYMCYTAYNGVEPPRAAATWISREDFLAKKWDAWSKPIIITPPGIDDKDTCILPEKVNGKYMIIHRIGMHVCADFLHTLDFEKEKALRCIRLLWPRPGMWDSVKVGIAGPPIKTNKGWVLLYHGVSSDSVYRVGAVLLDLKDPTIVLSRTSGPLFEPELPFEKIGQIPNVVFPCGTVLRKDMLYVYYGGADWAIGVATIKLSELVKALT